MEDAVKHPNTERKERRMHGRTMMKLKKEMEEEEMEKLRIFLFFC